MKKGTNKTTYRKKTRELLIRLIFQMASSGDFSDAAKDIYLSDKSLYIGDVSEDVPPGCIFDETKGEEPDIPYLNWCLICVRDHLNDIDGIIDRASEKWTIERMNAVDLAILRVAVAELFYMNDIEDSVSVNEAVLLAKKYGTEKSSVFINGILGAVARSKNEGGV